MCVDLCTDLSSTKVTNASGWPNETQIENLRRLASPFCQGFRCGISAGPPIQERLRELTRGDLEKFSAIGTHSKKC